MSQLAALIQQYVEDRLSVAFHAEGAAFATALRATAARRTGALAASVDWLPTGRFSGAIRMHAYGVYQSEGHRVARWGTARTRNRTRHPYKTAGRTVPTHWIERAWQQRRLGMQTRLLARLAQGR